MATIDGRKLDHKTLNHIRIQAVRRVLDVHHQSTLAQLQAALTALGLQAGVSVTVAG